MSKGKKIISILIIIFLLGLVVGCRKKKNDPSPIIDDEKKPPIVEPTEIIDQNKLTVYEGPEIMESSNLAKVSVNNQNLFVYETPVNKGRVFTFSDTNIYNVPLVIFDFIGKVSMEVEIPGVTITSAKVTPLSTEVETNIVNNKINFDLEFPCTYTVEYNDQSENVVHIIANPYDENRPDPNNIPDNMIYLGPGVYKSDAIPLESNKELYISGGAVVYGSIRAGYSENIKIRGSGIISGDLYDRLTSSEFTIPFEMQHCKNIILEGVTFLNPAGWTINNYFIDGMTIDNIHIFSARANGDGISIQSCKNITVKNSFVRTWDDALVVKNYDLGTTENILIDNTIVWTDLAQSMEVGYECYGETMNNIHFNNITILHNFHKPAISIHNADHALISDVKFTNITIEDAQMSGDNSASTNDDFLIDFNILFNQEWTSSGGERGQIKDVLIDNVLILAGKPNLIVRMNGYDETHNINNVTIKNVKYLDKEIKSVNDFNYKTNEYASNINVSYSSSTGAVIAKPYKVVIEKEDVNEIIPSASQKGLIVPDFAIGKVSDAYAGKVIEGNFVVNAYHGVSTTVWDDESGSFASSAHEANYLCDNNLDTYFEAKSWVKEVPTEYVAVNITLDKPTTIGAIRMFGDVNSKYYQTEYIAIYGLKSGGTKYSKIQGGTKYEFSPSNGNFVDVKITPAEFQAIQLRIYYREGISYLDNAMLSEIKLYPASLSFGQTVTGTEHEDVYKLTNIVDGLTTTYYEGKKGVIPANITVDFGNTYNIKYIIMNLPPYMQWEKRTQVISFQTSVDGVTFTDILVDQNCVFDPTTGNAVEIVLDEAVNCRYLKLIIKSNTASGGYSAQLSEISVYE